MYLPDTYTERTHAGVLSAAWQAEHTKSSVQEIYGISLAYTTDLVNSIPVDYMHCVLEGATGVVDEFIVEHTWLNEITSDNCEYNCFHHIALA